jgi:hypothetical protein
VRRGAAADILFSTRNRAEGGCMTRPTLDLDDIQGDVVVGLQKNYEIFVFFKIVDPLLFKRLVRLHIVGRVTSARLAHRRELILQSRNGLHRKSGDAMRGLNIGFTKDGLSEIIGAGRPRLDPSFERGADNRDTIEKLHDPSTSDWLKEFVSDRVDGILLLTGPNRSIVRFYCNAFAQTARRLDQGGVR